MVNHDRAQLILVGAIAIGIVLIGMTIVLNSAVFTENVAESNSVDVTGDVTEFDREAVRSVRSLTLRVNHATEYKTSGGSNGRAALAADLRSNVSNYSRIVGVSYADTGSVFVNVTLDSVGENGTRIVQDVDGDFSGNGNGAGNGAPVGDTWPITQDPYELGWFAMNLDVENVTDPFSVEVNNASSSLVIEFQQTSGGKLRIDSSAGQPVDCTPRNGRVFVDVAEGTAYCGGAQGRTSFNSTGYLQPPYTSLWFVDGHNGRGKYDVVINGTGSNTLPHVPPCASVQEPCESAAAWTVELTTKYETGNIAYDRTHNVSVYDP